MVCISRIPQFANTLTNQSSLIHVMNVGRSVIFYIEAVSCRREIHESSLPKFSTIWNLLS